jgi:hypothetical protein
VQTDSHFRKMVAGFCMVAAPVLFLVSAIVSPKLSTDGSDQLGLIAGHVDRWYISQVAALVGLVLFVPAILGLVHMLRERHGRIGDVGGGLTLIGTMAVTAATGTSLVAWQAAKPGLDAGQMGRLADRLTDTAGIVAVVFIPTMLVAIGMVVLAYGLYRARVIHPVSALCLAVGAVCLDIGLGPAASVALGIVGAAIFLVGLLPIGWAVLMETDEDWEHTPEFRGFRPPAGVH